MRRSFKAKRKRAHILKIRYLLFIALVYLSFDTTYGYLLDKKTSIEGEAYLMMALTDSNHHFTSKYKP